MNILIGLVIIIVLISAIGTLMITGNSDSHYSSATKRNTTNLTLIYAVASILSLIALGVYVL
jgi:hypothetical protein